MKYQNEKKIYAGNPRRHDDFIQRSGQAIAQLRALLKDPARIDMEYTRLRTLPYTKFETTTREGYPYLYGLTRDVTIEFNGKWNMGPYGVVIPLAFFEPMRTVYPDSSENRSVRNWKAIHMIPMRNILDSHRTPHHTARLRYANDSGVPVSNNPIDMIPNTCWGGFSSIVYACGDECDITELFRNIYIYLTRHDPHSPLVRMSREMTEGFSFAQRIS
jgi:hypothetical protein